MGSPNQQDIQNTFSRETISSLFSTATVGADSLAASYNTALGVTVSTNKSTAGSAATLGSTNTSTATSVAGSAAASNSTVISSLTSRVSSHST